MMYINNAILRKDYTPNTFIGGVGSTITSASSIATILNVPEKWIKNFNIVDDDIEFHIRKEYEIPDYAFQDNDEITYYRDEGEKLTAIGRGAFMNATEIEEVKGLRVERIGYTGVNDSGTFRGAVKLKRFLTSDKWTTANGRYEFYGCTLLEEIDISYLTTFINTPLQMFRNCKNLPPLAFNENYTSYLSDSMFRNAVLSGLNLNKVSIIGGGSGGGGAFRGATLLFETLYSEYVLSVRGFGFAQLNASSTIETIEFPNCTNIETECFYMISATSLRNIILPNVNIISGKLHFSSFQGDLIDLRSLKSFGTSTDSFLNISTQGVIIKVHEDIDPNDPNVVYALSRNAIIKLYDDNGDYVSTL